MNRPYQQSKSPDKQTPPLQKETNEQRTHETVKYAPKTNPTFARQGRRKLVTQNGTDVVQNKQAAVVQIEMRRQRTNQRTNKTYQKQGKNKQETSRQQNRRRTLQPPSSKRARQKQEREHTSERTNKRTNKEGKRKNRQIGEMNKQ